MGNGLDVAFDPSCNPPYIADAEPLMPDVADHAARGAVRGRRRLDGGSFPPRGCWQWDGSVKYASRRAAVAALARLWLRWHAAATLAGATAR